MGISQRNLGGHGVLCFRIGIVTRIRAGCHDLCCNVQFRALSDFLNAIQAGDSNLISRLDSSPFSAIGITQIYCAVSE
jgi:hypothetical protein